jgi:hypothetical protein
MKRKASDQQTSLSSLTFTTFNQLFTTIVSFLDAESQVALVCTNKKTYEYYRKQCNEQTFDFLCNTKTRDANIHKCLKAFERHMSHMGWKAIKVNLKLVPINIRGDYENLIKALYYKATSPYPTGVVDEANLNAFILDLYHRHNKSRQLDVDFFAKFSNLKLLSLYNATLSDYMISKISGLHLLEFISLYKCNVVFDRCLTNIFENFINLKEVQILFCPVFDVPSIELPPSLKSFKMLQLRHTGKVDASLCTQLECL